MMKSLAGERLSDGVTELLAIVAPFAVPARAQRVLPLFTVL
jgi:hypothetical protein